MNDTGKSAARASAPGDLAEIIRMVEDGKINLATGKSLLGKVRLAWKARGNRGT